LLIGTLSRIAFDAVTQCSFFDSRLVSVEITF
jgi:hypothetical protein